MQEGTDQLALSLKAASVAALEAEATVEPTGLWDFDTAPTVNGMPLGSGGGGGSTTDASLLTSGTLPVARIADGSLTAAKMAADVATQAELDAAYAAAVQRANHTGVQAISTITGLQTALDGKLSASASVPTIMPPSGDATGATDATNINAALVAGDVILRGNYTVGSAIVIPSNRSLILWDAEVVRVPGSSTGDAWIVVNKGVADNGYNNVGTITFSQTDISIVGLGKSRLRVSDPTLWSRSGITDVWRFIGILMVNVTRFSIDNVSIGPTQAFGACVQGVTAGRIRRVDLRQDATTINQDGFDVGPGCSDIVMDGITGTSGDDFFSIFAHYSASTMHPAWNSTNAPGIGDITDLTFRNVSVNAGINVFRLNAGGGRTLTRVQIENVVNRRSSLNANNRFLLIGESTYSGAPLPTVQQLHAISVRNVRPGRMHLLGLDNNCSNISISGVIFDNYVPSLIGKNNGATALTHNNISISDVTYGDPGTLGTISDIVNVATGTINGLTVRNLHIIRCQRLLNNGATITGLNVEDVYIGTLGSASVGSLSASTVAETGTMNDVWVGTYAGAFTGLYVGAAVKLRLGANMPVLTSADTTPLATTKGSVVVCDNTKQADAGAGTTAAQWVANGTNWIKAVDLGAMAGR